MISNSPIAQEPRLHRRGHAHAGARHRGEWGHLRRDYAKSKRSPHCRRVMNIEALLDRILTLNLIATTVVFYVTARIYLLPHLGTLRPRTVLIPILLLHSLRHLGLMFLTRGATYPGLPPQFAYPAALGDLVSAALAFVAIFFVSRNSAAARPLVWAFNVFGTIDLFTAITLATVYG